jgi:fructokinase
VPEPFDLPSHSVITIGELVVDWIAVKKSAVWDEPDTFLRSAGGNAANVARALSRLGTDARLVAKVGDDLHASYLLSGLAQAGIDTTFVSRTSAFATAQCYVLTDQYDENLFFNWPKPNACHQLTLDDLSEELFAGAVALHATGISLTVEPRSSAVIEAMRRARNSNLLVSFDAGFPTGEGEKAKGHALEAMALAHMIKVNLAELFYWLGDGYGLGDNFLLAEDRATTDISLLTQYAQTLRSCSGAEVVLLTLGARGSIIVSGGSYFAPAVKLELSAHEGAGVGAGDAYVAYVLSRLVKAGGCELNWSQVLGNDYFDWADIALRANAAGALATRTISASQGLATVLEIEQLLANNH